MALVEGAALRGSAPASGDRPSAEPPPAEAFYYLGRSQLALEPRRSSPIVPPGPVACRQTARGEHAQEHPLSACARAPAIGERDPEAAGHFEEAQRASSRRADADREALSRILDRHGRYEKRWGVAARFAADIADVRAAFRDIT